MSIMPLEFDEGQIKFFEDVYSLPFNNYANGSFANVAIQALLHSGHSLFDMVYKIN